MASLQSRIADLITAIGADIKQLKNATQDQHNVSTANQTGFAADTYLAGSVVSIPQGKVKVGTKYRARFNVVKTAAGVAAPVITLRVGTAGAIADTARNVLTFAIQTAVIDEGEFEVEYAFTVAGTVAVLSGLGILGHRLAATGLSTSNNSVAVNTGAAFDATLANLKMGLSVNGGTSAAWTVNLVSAELVNLTP